MGNLPSTPKIALWPPSKVETSWRLGSSVQLAQLRVDTPNRAEYSLPIHIAAATFESLINYPRCTVFEIPTNYHTQPVDEWSHPLKPLTTRAPLLWSDPCVPGLERTGLYWLTSLWTIQDRTWSPSELIQLGFHMGLFPQVCALKTDKMEVLQV